MKLKQNINPQNFKEIHDYVTTTYKKGESDQKAPQAFKAVLGEFSKKSENFYQNLLNDQNPSGKITEGIIELEQAADSALRSANQSELVNKELANQVQSAHDKVKEFKTNILDIKG